MLLELKRLEVPPGQRLLLRDVTWQEFETILTEVGTFRGNHQIVSPQFSSLSLTAEQIFAQ